MSRKNILIYKVAQLQSLSSSFVSNPTLIKYLDNCSYQINIATTDSIGTFKLQGSIDYSISEPTNDVINPGTWADLPLASPSGGAPNANAANDVILIDLNQVPFNALRVVYTSGTAGTGTCDIYVMAKQLGA